MSDTIIHVKGLTAKVKLNNGEMLTTVNNVEFSMVNGKSYAIVGKSGSGKTSLVSVLGLLNSSFEGEYFYENKLVNSMSDKSLSKLRSQKLGFVFQNYSLIEHLRVWENIELPLIYAKSKLNRQQRDDRIEELLKMVHLEDRKNDFPSNLSGGEQQRIAIARALVASPEVLICDEPTGALDKKTGEYVMQLLQSLVNQQNVMLILVTHDPDLAQNCDVILTMDGGRISDVSNSTYRSSYFSNKNIPNRIFNVYRNHCDDCSCFGGNTWKRVSSLC